MVRASPKCSGSLTRPPKISARLSDDLSVFDQTIDIGARQNQNIEPLAGIDPFGELSWYADCNIEPVTGRMLELRANLAQNIRDRPCGPDFELGGVGKGQATASRQQAPQALQTRMLRS
jgi:hypothetical protein